MNGKRAKALRKLAVAIAESKNDHVPGRQYRQTREGTVIVDPRCSQDQYDRIKREFGRKGPALKTIKAAVDQVPHD